MRRTSINGVVYYQLEAPVWHHVTHAIFTRLGGVSRPPFDRLNLGHTVGDELANVEENHRRALAAVGVQREQVVSPHQVHGIRVRAVRAAQAGTIQPGTDGLITAAPGVALLLRFADCVPLMMSDPVRGAVGVIHSGWRSTVGNIAQGAVDVFVEQVGSRPEDLWAGIGPSIGPCCYEIGSETVEEVQRVVHGSESLDRRAATFYLDLPGLVERQLRAAGVVHVETAGLCTACHTEEWFSHRAERGQTGRFGALVVLD